MIAGRGPAWDALHRQARKMGIEQHLYFTGYIDDATRNKLYQAAAAAVFPSLYEPFGIVALEAMAASVPVVVSATGGLADIVDHGVTGLKCYPDNALSLAEQLITILQKPRFAQQLAEQARQKVHKDFAWQEIAKQTRRYT